MKLASEFGGELRPNGEVGTADWRLIPNVDVNERTGDEFIVFTAINTSTGLSKQNMDPVVALAMVGVVRGL